MKGETSTVVNLVSGKNVNKKTKSDWSSYLVLVRSLRERGSKPDPSSYLILVKRLIEDKDRWMTESFPCWN